MYSKSLTQDEESKTEVYGILNLYGIKVVLLYLKGSVFNRTSTFLSLFIFMIKESLNLDRPDETEVHPHGCVIYFRRFFT